MADAIDRKNTQNRRRRGKKGERHTVLYSSTCNCDDDTGTERGNGIRIERQQQQLKTTTMTPFR